MAWNPKNALADLMAGVRQLLTFEEIAQGVVNANQDAIRVEIIAPAAPSDAGTLTITAGGASQQVFAANAARRWLLIQNISDAAMWVNFGANAAASQPSIYIAAGGYLEPLVAPTTTVTIFCATTGKAFTAKEA